MSSGPVGHLGQAAADPVGDQTYEHIVEAGRDVVRDFGPRRVTMAEVARRAGVSRMTLYRRFDSVDSLMAAVLTREMADVITHVIAESAAAGNARRRLVSEVVGTTRTLSRHSLLRRVIEVDPESLMPLIVARLGSGQRLIVSHVTARLKQGMASQGGDGSIRDDDPDLVALALLATGQSFVVSAAPLTHSYPDGRLGDQLALMIEAYLLPIANRGGPHD